MLFFTVFEIIEGFIVSVDDVVDGCFRADLGMEHGGEPYRAENAAGNGAVPSLCLGGHFENLAVLDRLTACEVGVRHHVFYGVGRVGGKNDIIGIPGEELLVADLDPIGVRDVSGDVRAARKTDHVGLIHGTACRGKQIGVARKVNLGLFCACERGGETFGLLGDEAEERICLIRSICYLADQRDHFFEKLLILGIYEEDVNAESGEAVCRAFQFHGEDDEVRCQCHTAFKVEFLCRADVGEVDQLGCAERIDRALLRLGFDAYELVLQIEGDDCARGNIVAADELLRFFFDGDGSARLIGNGHGVSRCGFTLVGIVVVIGICTSDKGQHDGKNQEQGKDFFHKRLLKCLFAASKQFRCIYKTTTKLYHSLLQKSTENDIIKKEFYAKKQ